MARLRNNSSHYSFNILKFELGDRLNDLIWIQSEPFEWLFWTFLWIFPQAWVAIPSKAFNEMSNSWLTNFSTNSVPVSMNLNLGFTSIKRNLSPYFYTTPKSFMKGKFKTFNFRSKMSIKKDRLNENDPVKMVETVPMRFDSIQNVF